MVHAHRDGTPEHLFDANSSIDVFSSTIDTTGDADCDYTLRAPHHAASSGDHTRQTPGNELASLPRLRAIRSRKEAYATTWQSEGQKQDQRIEQEFPKP